MTAGEAGKDERGWPVRCPELRRTGRVRTGMQGAERIGGEGCRASLRNAVGVAAAPTHSQVGFSARRPASSLARICVEPWS